jgi:hypothetical protein
MNRKVGDKFERAWTNYHLFAKKGKTGYDDFRFRMLVVRNNRAPAAHPGFKFVAVHSGYSIDEAWQSFFKVSGLRDFQEYRPAGDPGPVPAQSPLL